MKRKDNFIKEIKLGLRLKARFYNNSPFFKNGLVRPEFQG
jgi:hypothetical protein